MAVMFFATGFIFALSVKTKELDAKVSALQAEVKALKEAR